MSLVRPGFVCLVPFVTLFGAGCELTIDATRDDGNGVRCGPGTVAVDDACVPRAAWPDAGPAAVPTPAPASRVVGWTTMQPAALGELADGYISSSYRAGSANFVVDSSTAAFTLGYADATPSGLVFQGATVKHLALDASGASVPFTLDVRIDESNLAIASTVIDDVVLDADGEVAEFRSTAS